MGEYLYAQKPYCLIFSAYNKLIFVAVFQITHIYKVTVG